MPAEIKQDILYNFITNTAMAIEGFQRMIGGMDDLDDGIRKVEKNTSFLNRTLSTFIANIGVKLVGALTQTVGLIKGAFNQFVGFAKGATMQAARIEVQMRTLALTAGNAGERFEDVVKHLNALRAAGIKTGEAIGILSQFLANELPIDMVTELARRAQDMAVVIGTDSTEAFQRFNNFLQTGNSEWIRTMGIMKTGNQMLEEYARTQGKVVKALTERERKEALVQGLMKETLRYEGAYEEAMKDPYKRWTSLPRLISNVTEALGSLFVPIMGTVVDIASDALEKIERLFRVTKKEAKETGEVIGTWKEGFLRLRAVVTAFANWFMSLWNRLTGGFGDQAEGMMERFVNAIVRGVQIAANALRRFARFIAGIFGGRAPAEVTPGAVAATRPPARPEGPPRVAPPAGPPVETYVTPEKRRKLLEKPVAPAEPEDIAKYNELMSKWRDLTEKLGRATEVAAKAKERLAKAEDWLEKVSEKVYDIRRKIQRLELDWAEIPERFVRGRRKQLQLELQAAQHEEHEAQKVVKGEREKFQAAEEYRRELERGAEAAKRQADTVLKSLERQMEKYLDWKDALAEASEIRIDEPIQAIVNEFESLDDLMGVYLEEIEGQLMPAFADIEASVISIAENMGLAWDTAKQWAADMLEKLGKIRQWWDDLPEWVQNIFKGLGIAVALNFITKGTVGTVISGLIRGAFTAAGLIPGIGFTIAAGAIALLIAIKPFLSPEVQQAWKDVWNEIFKPAEEEDGGFVGLLKRIFLKGAEAAETTLEHTPILGIGGPFDKLVTGIMDLFRGSKDDMAEAAEEGVKRPFLDKVTELQREVVGHSVIPEMVEAIVEIIRDADRDVERSTKRGIMEPFLDVLKEMSKRAVGESIIPDMVKAIINWIERLAREVGHYLDQMAAKFRILEWSIRGLEPALADIQQFASGGNIQVVTVTGNTFTIGGGLAVEDVRRAIYDALFDLVSL